ncbi:unnamed protein product [Schistosoma mattheei]|uniref:Uncharacterized protein n=1 Tax=Schistosoma mattheei TaxID=31246 RepID=A0A3P8DFV6_9TREM|nr:unnamed protein product [Schistosoma mattheei]
MSLESERIRLFKEYIISIDNSNEDSHRSRKDKHLCERSASIQDVEKDVDAVKDQKKKQTVSPSPAPSEHSHTRRSDDERGSSQKRKHRKSKKSKHRKSKHHKHHKNTDKRQDEELEEGEAADDDDEDDEAVNPQTSDRVNPLSGSKRHRHHRRGQRSRTSDPEDGEEVDSTSDAEFYDRDSKRKKR